MARHLADLLVRRRKILLVLLTLVVGWATALAVRVPFDFTPQAVFAGNDDLVNFSEEFKQVFGHEDAILLVVLQATGKDDLLAPRLLTWQAELALRLKRLPQVVRVESLGTMKTLHAHLFGRRKLSSGPLIAKLPVDAEAAEKVRATLEGSLAEGALVSKDKRVAAVLVCLDPQARDIDSMRGAVLSAKKVVNDFPPPEDCQVSYSGLPALRVDIVDELIADQVQLLPLAALLFLLVLAALYRCVAGTVLPLLATGAGLALSVGALVVTGQTLNIINNIIPALLLIFGVSCCVHVINRYAEESYRCPGQRETATRRTMENMLLPCFLTYITTASGFLSLIAAHSLTLRDFGWQAALGMVLLYLVSMAIFAALLPYLSPPKFERSDAGSSSWVANVVSLAGYTVARSPRLTVGVSLGIIALCLWFGRGLTLNSFMVETYDEEHTTIHTMRLVERSLGGFLPLEISLQADRPDRFTSPQVYAAVAEAERFAAQLPGTLFARSYVDLNQEIYSKTRMREELYERMPADDENGRRRVARTHGICRQFADALGYNYFLTPDGLRARVLLRLEDVGTQRTLWLIAQLESKLAELFPADGGVRARLTGDAYLNAKVMDGFVRDLFQSLLCASIFIFGVIGLLFRSVRIGFIAILPNIFPLTVTLGYMGLCGYDLNVGNVIVFSISLGVAVDNTIHFISRFREEIHHSGDVADAIYRAYQGAGRAMVLSSVLVVSGLAILLVSDFVPTRRFAELTGVTMAAALLGDLLVLPAMITLFWKRDHRPAPVSAPRTAPLEPARA